MSKVLVTYVNRYDFPDSKTGRVIKGAKVHFIDSKIPCNRPNDQKGIPPVEMGISYEEFEKYTTVPAVYELDIANVPAGGGKLTAIITGSKFLKDYKFNLE